MFLRSTRSLLAFACAGAAWTCGQNLDYDGLRKELETGRLEEVELALTGNVSAAAAELLVLAETLRSHREEVERELERFVVERETLTSTAALSRLRKLLHGERDQVLRERVENALAECLEWAGNRSSDHDGPPFVMPGKPYEEARDA